MHIPDTSLSPVREREQAEAVAQDERQYARAFAQGQQAALTLLHPHEARAIAGISTQYIIDDDWYPVPAYGWGLDLYMAAHGLDDPCDASRDDIESFAEKLLGTAYPDAVAVCGFIGGVADVVDRL
ncbi:hypothetical protein [Paraburkholderia diazotrophica]|uniref:Uncharacterized protein n=1 Tax=Paraburkholderia diazotrophica TaxID=667676 RepID=A0A1H7CC36_9BURK|nr:hypothetical protein [Paraburkholderia diazotrophica]SEJ87403.1 hypothetical protein SAMN05192539_102179 [Paraburkholderia diazotrophica]